MVKNMESTDFHTFFTATLQQRCLLKENCDFLVPLNISDQIHIGYFVQNCFISKKMHKVVKNKAQGCSAPLINDHFNGNCSPNQKTGMKMNL